MSEKPKKSKKASRKKSDDEEVINVAIGDFNGEEYLFLINPNDEEDAKSCNLADLCEIIERHFERKEQEEIKKAKRRQKRGRKVNVTDDSEKRARDSGIV